MPTTLKGGLNVVCECTGDLFRKIPIGRVQIRKLNHRRRCFLLKKIRNIDLGLVTTSFAAVKIFGTVGIVVRPDG